jgi:hypothetical protein
MPSCSMMASSCCAGEARGNSDGTPINAGAEWGGWLMKINPDTNGVIWSVRSKPAISWNKVTESPDGIIFTAGNFLPSSPPTSPP